MDHTVFTLQTQHHTCLYLVSIHQTAPPLTSHSSHRIAAYYSFIASPSIWNSLPLTVRDMSLTFTGFCRRLKTELYKQA